MNNEIRQKFDTLISENPSLKGTKLYKSDKASHRLKVELKDGTIIYFGDPNNVAFVDHHNEARRRSYLARSSGIRDRNGKLTADNPHKANFWARHILW